MLLNLLFFAYISTLSLRSSSFIGSDFHNFISLHSFDLKQEGYMVFASIGVCWLEYPGCVF